MLLRLRYNRRLQVYVKILAGLILAVFYFTFLFRETINAFEQNKEKAAAAAVANALTDVSYGQQPELHSAPKLLILARQKHLLKQKQQQSHTMPATDSVPSTFNPIYEYSEEIHSATEKDLQRRHAHLDKICKRYKLQYQYPPNPWEFFISTGHNLVWCNVFKAASSTWLYYFNILAGYDLRFLQRTEFPPLQLARKCFPRPKMPELLESLGSSLSFLFVRDPFERIVSAYRNKLEGGRNAFYKVLGQRIINQYRKYAPGVTRIRGPTFEEFVSFLIDQHEQKKRFDEHWAPVYNFCTPCSVNFTIIGKVETFKRDSEFIIRQAGLESLLLGKVPRHKMRKIGNLAAGVKTDGLLVERYFAEINSKTLDQLLNIYRFDFELFDYNYAKYYQVVQQLAENTTSHVGSTTTTTTAAKVTAQKQNNLTLEQSISTTTDILTSGNQL